MEEAEAKGIKSEHIREEDLTSCRCSELEETSKKAEERIVRLESEIEKSKSEYEALQAKFKELIAEKKSVEDELRALRTSNFEVRKHGDSAEGKNIITSTGAKGKEGVVVDLTVDLDGEEDDENIAGQLIVENHVLEVEKKKAQSEVDAWKKKFQELELWISQVDDSTIMRGGKRLLTEVIKGEERPDVRTGIGQLQINEKSMDPGPNCCTPGTPYKDNLCSHTPLVGKQGIHAESERQCHRLVRRHLSFEKEERSPNKNMAPSTPGGINPACLNVVYICDSDSEDDLHHIQSSIPDDQSNRKNSTSTDHVLAGTLDGKQNMISESYFGRAGYSPDYEEIFDDSKDNVPCVSTSKRKRAAKIVTSDTEGDEDDNIPISKLKKEHLQESITDIPDSNVNFSPKSRSVDVKCTITRSRRRLVTLRQRELPATEMAERSSANIKRGQGIPTTGDVEDSEFEEFGSEGESLGGFIVDSSDVSNTENLSSQSDDNSDSDVDFDEILSKFQRRKNPTLKWELEADMLSAFGKDLELCMKAVCSLYRQQTPDEQVSKETMYCNNRGFSKFDALRGSDLARFLTDGDPHGDLKKSAKQLEEKGSKAVELCRTLATRYSKQLFEIYKNKEDPLFLPC